MDGAVGDRVIGHAGRVGQGSTEGEIVEVMGSETQRSVRVRWSDGHESLLFVGADVTIEPPGATRAREALVVMELVEDADQCTATATLSTANGMFRAEGRARRRPSDPAVPMIGEELAIARALRALAGMLEEAAAAALDAKESRPLHLV
jgi:hypothetical protein